MWYFSGNIYCWDHLLVAFTLSVVLIDSRTAISESETCVTSSSAYSDSDTCRSNSWNNPLNVVGSTFDPDSGEYENLCASIEKADPLCVILNNLMAKTVLGYTINPGVWKNLPQVHLCFSKQTTVNKEQYTDNITMCFSK